MISPPSCKNSKCDNFDKYIKDEILKMNNKKNFYKCTKCGSHFSWSMPKFPKGVIY